MTSMTDINHVMARYITFFENISPSTLPQADDIFSCDVYFRDPFNELKTRHQLKQVFHEMFTQCDSYGFRISSSYLDTCEPSNSFVLKWRFSAVVPRIGELDFDGLSEVTLNNTGQVISHIDYWDASTHFYMKVPILKQLIRFVRRKLIVAT